MLAFNTYIAAPRLRQNLLAVTQGSQSLALGLAPVAASQLPQKLTANAEARERFKESQSQGDTRILRVDFTGGTPVPPALFPEVPKPAIVES